MPTTTLPIALKNLADNWKPEPNIGALIGIDAPFSVALSRLHPSAAELRELKEYFNSKDCKNPHRYSWYFFQTTAFKHANATIDSQIKDAEEQVKAKAQVKKELKARGSSTKLNNPLVGMLLRGALLASMAVAVNSESTEDKKANKDDSEIPDYLLVLGVMMMQFSLPYLKYRLSEYKYWQHIVSGFVVAASAAVELRILRERGVPQLTAELITLLYSPNLLFGFRVSSHDLVGFVANLPIIFLMRQEDVYETQNILINVFLLWFAGKATELLSEREWVDERLAKEWGGSNGMQLKVLQLSFAVPLFNELLSFGLTEAQVVLFMTNIGLFLPILSKMILDGRGIETFMKYKLEVAMGLSSALTLRALPTTEEWWHRNITIPTIFFTLGAAPNVHRYFEYHERLRQEARETEKLQIVEEKNAEKRKEQLDGVVDAFGPLFPNMNVVRHVDKVKTVGVDTDAVDISFSEKNDVRVMLKQKTEDSKDSQINIAWHMPKAELFKTMSELIKNNFTDKDGAAKVIVITFVKEAEESKKSKVPKKPEGIMTLRIIFSGKDKKEFLVTAQQLHDALKAKYDAEQKREEDSQKQLETGQKNVREQESAAVSLLLAKTNKPVNVDEGEGNKKSKKQLNRHGHAHSSPSAANTAGQTKKSKREEREKREAKIREQAAELATKRALEKKAAEAAKQKEKEEEQKRLEDLEKKRADREAEAQEIIAGETERDKKIKGREIAAEAKAKAGRDKLSAASATAASTIVDAKYPDSVSNLKLLDAVNVLFDCVAGINLLFKFKDDEHKHDQWFGWKKYFALKSELIDCANIVVDLLGRNEIGLKNNADKNTEAKTIWNKLRNALKHAPDNLLKRDFYKFIEFFQKQFIQLPNKDDHKGLAESLLASATVVSAHQYYKSITALHRDAKDDAAPQMTDEEYENHCKWVHGQVIPIINGCATQLRKLWASSGALAGSASVDIIALKALFACCVEPFKEREMPKKALREYGGDNLVAFFMLCKSPYCQLGHADPKTLNHQHFRAMCKLAIEKINPKVCDPGEVDLTFPDANNAKVANNRYMRGAPPAASTASTSTSTGASAIAVKPLPPSQSSSMQSSLSSAPLAQLH